MSSREGFSSRNMHSPDGCEWETHLSSAKESFLLLLFFKGFFVYFCSNGV
jgi:hypothetical protein